MAIGKKVIMPSQTGKDITLLYSDSTILKIKLQAPQMQMYDKDVKQRVTIMPKGLFVIFYDDNGKEATTLKANYGVRYDYEFTEQFAPTPFTDPLTGISSPPLETSRPSLNGYSPG